VCGARKKRRDMVHWARHFGTAVRWLNGAATGHEIAHTGIHLLMGIKILCLGLPRCKKTLELCRANERCELRKLINLSLGFLILIGESN